MLRSSIVTAALNLLILSGCAGVTVHDSEWCGSLGSQGAACFHVLTSSTEQLSLQEWAERWDDLSNALGPQVCGYASSFADIKADVEKLCSFNNVCTYDMTEQVAQISSKLDKAIEMAKKANGK